jgi:restriction system protein
MLREDYMALPSYQQFIYPVLKIAHDGKEYSMREIYDQIADQMGITEEERQELLPSGTQQIYKNRIGWAKTYLVKAGLLESQRRGYFNITEKGKEVLNSGIDDITVDYLLQFYGFADFAQRNKKEGTPEGKGDEPTTPEEQIERAIEEINMALASEVLESIMKASPSFFEQVVVELLVKMGYGGSRKEAGKVVGKSGDEGIDGIIKEDKLGLDIIYIQAKRWDSAVSRPEIQKFVGALQGKRAKKGIFITTSTFSKQAEEYTDFIDNKVILIDGKQLANLMIENEIGVTRVKSYQVNRIDTDYFLEE